MGSFTFLYLYLRSSGRPEMHTITVLGETASSLLSISLLLKLRHHLSEISAILVMFKRYKSSYCPQRDVKGALNLFIENLLHCPRTAITFLPSILILS